MIGQLALLVVGVLHAPEEAMLRDWIKAPVAGALQLASGRKVGIAKNAVVYAPDGQTCALTDIEVGEPVCVELDFKGNASKIIRWNSEGVVKARVPLDTSFKNGWDIVDSASMGSEVLGQSMEFDNRSHDVNGARESALSNPARFDAVSFSEIGDVFSDSHATLSFVKGGQELWSSPVTGALRTFIVDISELESVGFNFEFTNWRGLAYTSNWTFLRYAWKTPKPLSPQSGQKLTRAAFSWSSVDKADGYLVEVQRTGGAALRDPSGAFTTTVVAGNSMNLDALPAGSYRWRVHSLKGGSIWSPAADWRSFEKA